MTKIKTRRVVIDRHAAYEMLKKNDRNRPFNHEYAKRLARDMAAGHWNQDNPQPICIDETGNLINGQHRLAGVVLADRESPGIKLAFTIVSGLSADVATVIDTGPQRTVAHNLSRFGYDNTTMRAAALRQLRGFEHFRESRSWVGGTTTATMQEIYDYAARCPEADEEWAHDTQRIAHALGVPRSNIGGALLIIKRYGTPDRATYDAFTAGLCKGGAGPVKVLRKILQEHKGRHSGLEGRNTIGTIIKGWNAHVLGGTPTIGAISLRFDPDREEFPEPC